MYFATKTIVKKLHAKQLLVKQGQEPSGVYFVRTGRLKVVKQVKFRTIPSHGFMYYGELTDEPMKWELSKGHFEEKLLQLDVVGPNDVLCHHCVIDHTSIPFSVVSEVPSELYVINEMDFLTLDKKLLAEFKEFQKAYPPNQELRQMFYEARRWKMFKSQITSQIQTNKQLKGGVSFRGSLSQPKIIDPAYLSLHD